MPYFEPRDMDPMGVDEAPMPELVRPDEYRKQVEATIEAANQHLDGLHQRAKQVAIETHDAERVLAMARAAADVYDGEQERGQ